MTVDIGPISIHLYGVIVMLGVLMGAMVAANEARRYGLSSDLVWDFLPWGILGGVIGARLWHILFPPESMQNIGITTGYYLTHPFEAIAIWKGGLGLPGVVIGGAVALWLYLRHKGYQKLFLRFADILAPGLALGQAIGRWGNYVNQELYGYPTDLPWAIYIEPQHRLPGYEQFSYYHPLFLYESLWNLGNMLVLLMISRRFRGRLLPGDVFLVYLAIYSFGRFWLEFLRLDVARVSFVNPNQMLMALVLLASVGVLWFRHRRLRQ